MGTPRTEIKGRLAQSFADDRAVVALESIYQSSRRTPAGTTIPAQALTNLVFTAARLWGGLRMTAAVQNLFDVRSRTPADPSIARIASRSLAGSSGSRSTTRSDDAAGTSKVDARRMRRGHLPLRPRCPRPDSVSSSSRRGTPRPTRPRLPESRSSGVPVEALQIARQEDSTLRCDARAVRPRHRHRHARRRCRRAGVPGRTRCDRRQLHGARRRGTASRRVPRSASRWRFRRRRRPCG